MAKGDVVLIGGLGAFTIVMYALMITAVTALSVFVTSKVTERYPIYIVSAAPTSTMYK